MALLRHEAHTSGTGFAEASSPLRRLMPRVRHRAGEALDELAVLDERQAQIVELRYFGGLSEDEVAELLSISRATVTRDWQTARFWLHRRLTSG